ncbi:hypothetical protein MMPV_007552 [Pyropia vietnamensis]
MAYTMYTYPANPRAQCALIAAELSGITVDVPEFALGKDNKTDEFLALNPLGRVPTLKLPSGAGVFESEAIARYMARVRPEVGLTGATFAESTAVDCWVSLVYADLAPALMPLVWVHLFNMKYDGSAATKAKAALDRVLTTLDSALLSQTYLVGERVTLADTVMVSFLNTFMTHVLDAKARDAVPNVMRYFNTLTAQPAFAKVLGEVKLCGDPLAPAKKEKPAKKEVAKPAAAAAPTAEEAEPKKPKSKGPYDDLPKSSMDLDAWKREYSNNDTREVALPLAVEELGQGGLLPYNSELEKTFMSANLITGWFQRCEHLRKYIFGNVLIFGSSGPPGSTLPPEWDQEGNDAFYYEWKKLDLANPQDKALVEDYFAWDGKFEGGKTFK